MLPRTMQDRMLARRFRRSIRNIFCTSSKLSLVLSLGWAFGFKVWVFMFRAWGLGFGVYSLWCMVHGPWFMVHSLGFRIYWSLGFKVEFKAQYLLHLFEVVPGVGFEVEGSSVRIMVQGSGCRVWGWRFKVYCVWFVVYDLLSMICSLWFMVHGSWFKV